MTKAELIAKTAKVKAAQRTASTALDDATALEAMVIFDEWQTATVYAVNDRIRYADKLYKCNIAHTSQDDWRPDKPSALWSEVSADEWAEWKQPKGAHDAYNAGDKCSYKGKHWICTSNGNIYPPDVFGWVEA